MHKVLSGIVATVSLTAASLLVATPSYAAPSCVAAAGTVTCDFVYSGAAETWTVPDGVTEITASVWGAGGGDAGARFTLGGKGGSASAQLPVEPGQSVVLVVGGAGGSGGNPGSPQRGTGGFNGGAPDAGQSFPAGGGGGASDIRIGGTGLADRVLVAGGGGGGSNMWFGTIHSDGGDGGGLTGRDGVPASTSSMGGDQTGGTGSGLLGVGAPGVSPGSAGGGGGFYGGGGGDAGNWGDLPSAYSSGGGGSGHGPAGVEFETGVQAGNGRATISYALMSAVAVTPSRSAMLVGDTVDFEITASTSTPGFDLTGAVELFAGTDSLGTFSVDANGAASVTGLKFPAGRTEIVAEYSGNLEVAAARSEPASVNVSRMISTTMLTVSSTTLTDAETFDVTAAVTGIHPTGTVEFVTATGSLGTATLVNGMASLSGLSEAAGTYAITAIYSGDASNTASRSLAQNLTVEVATLTPEPEPEPEPEPKPTPEPTPESSPKHASAQRKLAATGAAPTPWGVPTGLLLAAAALFVTARVRRTRG